MQSILVFAPNWIGDAVMATPALRALHRRFPEARITVAARNPVCAILEGLPYVSAFLPLDGYRGRGGLLRFRRDARATAYDGAVVLPHSFRAALLAWLCGAPRRLGYRRNGRAWLLTDVLEPHKEDGRVAPVYMAREYLELVGRWGCDDDGEGLELHVDPEEVAAVRRLSDPERQVAAIAPGAAFGPSKRWSPSRYAAVADALAGQEIDTMLLWGPGEEDTRDAVRHGCHVPLLTPYENTGPTIARLKAAIAAADILIGNDSGPRHIAIAFGKPVVCIMGPTSPKYTDSPWEKGAVLRIDVDCGPCQQPVCRTDHRCMHGIHIEDVLRAVRAHLPPKASSAESAES